MTSLFQRFRPNDFPPPPPTTAQEDYICHSLAELKLRVVDISPDLLQLFLTRNLYRESSVTHLWPTAERAQLTKIKDDLRTKFGLSERGFSSALTTGQIGLLFQCIQGTLPEPAEEVPSRDIVVPAGGIPAVQFSGKILLDQGPFPIDFTSCSRDERALFLIHALRHRLELPSFRDLPQAAAPASADDSTVYQDDWRLQMEEVAVTNDDCLFDCIARLLRFSDVISREYLLSALLDRRACVPLLLFWANSVESPLSSMLLALSLTRTRITNGQVVCLATDRSCMRVAVVSLHSRTSYSRNTNSILTDLFHVKSLDDGLALSAPILEAGFGFVEMKIARKDGNGFDKAFETVIVLHLVDCDDAIKSRVLPLVDVAVYAFPRRIPDDFRPNTSCPSPPTHFICLEDAKVFRQSKSMDIKGSSSKMNMFSGRWEAGNEFERKMKELLQSIAQKRNGQITFREPLTTLKEVLTSAMRDITIALAPADLFSTSSVDEKFNVLSAERIRCLKDMLQMQKNFHEIVKENR